VTWPWRVVAAGVVLLAGAGSLVFVLPQRSPTALVDGRLVVLAHTRSTVRDALLAAGIHLGPGQVLAAVTHRPLAGYGAPAFIAVDGKRARLSSWIRSGARIQAHPGTLMEPLVTKEVPTGPPGLPDIEFYLWHPGSQEVLRQVVGAYSGQVISSAVVSPEQAATRVTDKEVALTFDDGPNPQWTPQILHVLAAAGIKATFCSIGEEAAAYPQLVQAEAQAGMTLCDHTWDHDEHLVGASPAHIQSEIGQAATEITKDSGGVAPQFYRPPGGFLSPQIISAAHGAGLRVLYWSVDTVDWQRPPVATIVARALQAGPGGIILLHDGGGDRSATVAALPTLIAGLEARGYRFTTPALVPPAPAAPGNPIPVTPIPQAAE
jgi:peptidoglycan/xylan/chitin deacetylase (PgdA/CDA1 family)